jgi:hypothetical protein
MPSGKEQTMDKTPKAHLYDICSQMRNEGKSWLEVHKEVKRLKLITLKTTVQDLIEIFRDVAGEVAVHGDIKELAFDEYVREFFQFIGKSRANIATKAAQQIALNNITAVISDVHVPYHDMGKLTRALDDAKANGATRLIIAGDFLNGTQLSNHATHVHEDFKKELMEGRALLEMMAADFAEVILMDDNHVHRRWQDYIADRMRPDLHFLTLHPYDYMCSGLPNVKRANSANQLGDLAEPFRKQFGWFYKQGDAVFTHSEKHSANENKMLRDIADWFRKWEPILQLGEIRVLGQAHNHNVGMIHEADRILLFTGCLVSLEGLTYSMSAKCAGSPPCHGYVLLVQDEHGRTDIEKTRPVRIAY